MSQIFIRDTASETAPACETGNEFDGNLNVRISSIFVILVGSLFGALFPILARKVPAFKVSEKIFFFVKYFGSGVIVATAFIHLLTPANEALTNPCLTGVIASYPWAQAIAMMSVFSLFFVELLALSFATFSSFTGAHDDEEKFKKDDPLPAATTTGQLPGQNHLSHVLEHQEIERAGANHDHERDDHHHCAGHSHDHSHGHAHGHAHHHGGHQPEGGEAEAEARSEETSVAVCCDAEGKESYAAQLTSIFILEFGVVFHSIFIGLTLAVSGAEFRTLYPVLVFHQLFEGLALGSRLAVVPFPKAKKLTPYLMAAGYGISTPIAIAIGLGVRNSYPPEGRTTLIVNGVFDSISAGILLYTGMVELMAHEFLFSATLRKGKRRVLFGAFGWMTLGAGLMALLGKWA